MLVANTGGTGFIGRALFHAHAKRGDKVRILSRGHQLYQDSDNNVDADIIRIAIQNEIQRYEESRYDHRMRIPMIPASCSEGSRPGVGAKRRRA